MSENPNTAVIGPQTGRPAKQPRYGTQYRSVSWLAVASVVCGALSFTTVFGWYLLLVPLAGIALGWNARQRIRELPGELTGTVLAWIGMTLSVLLGTLGIGALVVYEMREVPFGYTLITYAELQPDPSKPNARLPADVEDLDGKRVFIKGFIYPGKRTIAIQRFILVPTLGHCNFCSTQMKSTDMIAAQMAGDMRTNFKQRMVGIGGTMKIDKKEAAKPFGGFPYQLEVDYVR